MLRKISSQKDCVIQKTLAKDHFVNIAMEHNNIPIDKLDKRFPTVFDLNGSYGNGAPPKTVLELRAMAVSGAIREKKNWIEKLKNNEIKQRWIDELQAEGVTNEVIKYVFDELEQYYSKLQDGLVVPSPADGVCQADGLISEDLRKELIQGVYPLENVDSSKLDWHPGSNEQVLDLVHPSLYCYVIGQTKTHEGIWPAPWSDFLGSGASERVKKGFFSSIIGRSKQWLQKITTFDYGHKPGISEKYQWLPAEFDIDKEGKVQIQSYINNLHPEIHVGLYSTLERIFERFIPMFNKTLTEALHQRPNRIKCEYVSYPEGVDEYDPHRIPIQPPLPNFTLPPRPKTRVDLRGRNLQVIVKMANIHLTPDKPEYDGGVWHVEGMDNERIIATGIYYYHTDNITTSKLSFRTSVTTPGYAQDDRIGPPMVFGLAEDAPLVQPVGSVITEQDRCIVFPNLYQHKVESFKLADPTKPGSRKILVFFLVDPGTPIVSTAVVPPQQSEWYKLQLMKQFEGTLFETLPPEMQLEILNKTSEAMSLETAKHHREELMKERKFINDMDNGLVFERQFSLCEH